MCSDMLSGAATNHDTDIWKMYPVQRLVVEAPSEREAREQVAEAAEAALPPNPWLDPDLMSCERCPDQS